MSLPTETPPPSDPLGDRRDDPNTPPAKVPPRRSIPPGFILAVVAMVAIMMVFGPMINSAQEVNYGVFRKQLEKDNIASLDLQERKVVGEFKDPPLDPAEKTDRAGNPAKLEKKFTTTLPLIVDSHLDDLIIAKMGEKYKVTTPIDSMYLLSLFSMVGLPLLVIGAIFFMLRRTQSSIFGGGGILGFSKSPARKYEQGDRRVTFNDVAGLEGVKAELQEIVEFLKNPKKFQRLGGRVPKGILLMGPPGTGKTLLGRAVAGEAGVPFYSINGSEFIQMFVGVGAGRVRDLFATAKESAPCILFIDEIDAVGRHRGTGVGGGNDEREQTLNQILSEMDGFTQTEAVIVMAATNRPDVLDPALLRPGRFDRHITVDRPTYKGRLAIFGVHTRGIPLAADVDLERLAAGSVGLTGADIRNLVNEATLWASCHDKEAVDMSDFDYARDKVLMGAKREEVLSGKEKTITAYHEAGHTLLAWLIPGADRIHKVSIIPRGRALGVTLFLPEEDRVNISESSLQTFLLIDMGGRAAEKLVFDEFSAGAENDLSHATHIARRMVTHWGMSDRLGPVAFRDSEDQPFLGREIAEPRRFSEHTAQLIDEEVSRILRAASDRAREMLAEHRGQLDCLAKTLEVEETLDDVAIEKLLGPPAWKIADAANNGKVEEEKSQISNLKSQTNPNTQ
jgi:cell division protease FtsH